MLRKSTLPSSLPTGQAALGLPLTWTSHIFTAAAVGEIAGAGTEAGAAAAAGHNSNLQFSMLIRLILRARCRSDYARRRRPFWRSTKECYKLCSTAWESVRVCVCTRNMCWGQVAAAVAVAAVKDTSACGAGNTRHLHLA